MLGELEFVTDEDERLILDEAARQTFAAGAVVLEEGARREALFVLRSGVVRIELLHTDQRIAIARLAAGSLFGEMSFLESTGASANVVAEEAVEVDVIEGDHIRALVDSLPGFGTRLYQSLAVLLARRLREQNERLSPLLVEEVAQVTRFHARRASLAEVDRVPPNMIHSVEAFKSALLLTDAGLKDGKLDADEARGAVAEACSLVHDTLGDQVRRHPELEGEIGAYVFRETFPFFMQSPFIDRSFSKPRGYGGDYATIDMIYDNEPAGIGRLAPLVDAWALDQKTPRAVRNRRVLMADTIERVQGEANGRLLITSVGSGSARELFDFFERGESPDAHAICIDIDPEALTHSSALAENLALGEHFTFARENVLRLIRDRGETQIEPQHLIYSLGLTDYLEDRLVLQLLNWIYDHLLPGGTAAFGNMEASNPDRAYMDHILEWGLIYRTADEMERLFHESRFGDAPVDVRPEEEGVQLSAFARRL